MSTRSNIGMVSKDGKSAQVIYCHSDGYPSYNGRVLLEHYQDEKKIKQLINLGDLSSLGKEIGEKHDFNEYDSPWCRAYGRDRGEDGVGARNHLKSDLLSWERLRQNEYLYLWADGAWWFTDGFRLTLLTPETCSED